MEYTHKFLAISKCRLPFIYCKLFSFFICFCFFTTSLYKCMGLLGFKTSGTLLFRAKSWGQPATLNFFWLQNPWAIDWDLICNLVVMPGLSLTCFKLSATQKVACVFTRSFSVKKIYAFLQIFKDTFCFNKDLFTTFSESKYVPDIKCIAHKYILNKYRLWIDIDVQWSAALL